MLTPEWMSIATMLVVDTCHHHQGVAPITMVCKQSERERERERGTMTTPKHSPNKQRTKGQVVLEAVQFVVKE
jgi:hypothetical protein